MNHDISIDNENITGNTRERFKMNRKFCIVRRKFIHFSNRKMQNRRFHPHPFYVCDTKIVCKNIESVLTDLKATKNQMHFVFYVSVSHLTHDLCQNRPFLSKNVHTLVIVCNTKNVCGVSLEMIISAPPTQYNLII